VLRNIIAHFHSEIFHRHDALSVVHCSGKISSKVIYTSEWKLIVYHQLEVEVMTKPSSGATRRELYSNDFFKLWFGVAVVFWILYISKFLMMPINNPDVGIGGFHRGIARIFNSPVGSHVCVTSIIITTIAISCMAHTLKSRLKIGRVFLDINAAIPNNILEALLGFFLVAAGVWIIIFGSNAYSSYALFAGILGSQLVIDSYSRVQMCENGIIAYGSIPFWEPASLGAWHIIPWRKIGFYEWIVEPALWIGIDDSKKTCQLKLMLKDMPLWYIFWDMRETVNIEMPYVEKEMAEAILLEHFIQPYEAVK
jgi:hypothetical protein